MADLKQCYVDVPSNFDTSAQDLWAHRNHLLGTSDFVPVPMSLDLELSDVSSDWTLQTGNAHKMLTAP